MVENEKVSDSYAVIGAGPSGLASSRALNRLGIKHRVYEKHSGVGGIWDIDNPGSPMYDSAHFISSRSLSGFYGYPMPEDYPDYPSHDKVHRYLENFSDTFDLAKNIEFDSEVLQVKPLGRQWEVQLADGSTHVHRGIICANGVTWLPQTPQWPGSFLGEIRHSNSYRSVDEFKGKRVLIVGLGNSGADIACDAARQADSAWISVRRGYHFFPKHIAGWPTDVFFRKPELLPESLQTLDLASAVGAIIGNPQRLGMPVPDHERGQSHPLANSQLLHHLGHGDIEVKPDIERLDGHDVVFEDGSRLQVDLILMATGYQVKAPYLDDALFELKGQRVQHYLNIFNREHPELFTVGFAEVAGGIYPLIDQMAHMVAHHIHDRIQDSASVDQFEALKANDDFDVRGGNDYVSSDRHQNYVDLKSYFEHISTICKRFGWRPLDDTTYRIET